MKPASSLYVQIFSRLFVFLLALVAIGFIAFNAHFGVGWEALLNSPLGDRVEAITGSLDTQLWSASSSHWDEILRNFDNLYGAKFYVFDFTGAQVAGDSIKLPPVVTERFVEPHFKLPAQVGLGFSFADAHAMHGGTVVADPRTVGPGGAPIATRGFAVARTFPPGPAITFGAGVFPPPEVFHSGPGGPPPPGEFHEFHEFEGGPGGPLSIHEFHQFHRGPGGPGGPKSEGLDGGDGPPQYFHGGHGPQDFPGGPAGGPVAIRVGPDGPGSAPGGPDKPGAQHAGPDVPRPVHVGPADGPESLHIEAGGAPPPPFHVRADGSPAIHMVRGENRILVHSEKPDKFWFVSRVPVMTKNGWPIPGAIIASPNSMWQTGLLIDFSYVAFVAVIVVVLSLLFWCPLIYQITKALSDVTATTKSIAEGDFAARVSTQRRDEIGRLADAVNAMAERLDTFITRQRRLLSDISHELVSPIARLQMALELLSVSIPQEKASLVKDINEEVVEMTNLVNELLAYSKAGVKGPDIELLEINLKEMFDKLVDRLDQEKIVDVDVPADVTVLAEPILIERSFANILRNSIRYAGDCGPITVRVPVISSHVAVVISDKGPGVPEEALRYLAEPFYRPEFCRSRDTGGVGLGLAIVKTCVEACGGSLSFRNRLSGGFEVEVRLKHRPLRAPAEKKTVRQNSV